MVIVELSANSSCGLTDDDGPWCKMESFALFRVKGNHIAAPHIWRLARDGNCW